MGVPGLFLWLIKKYDKNNIVINKQNLKELDSLFLDTNCLLHPQCFKVLENYKGNDIKILEDLMISECIKYIEYLIEFINPSKLLYISIDGVAPFAKIDQQRSRRFHSAKKNYQIITLKKKWNINDNKINWTNASITPGTIFMEKLDNKLKNWILYKKKMVKFKIIYSSCYMPAEGEHKILQYIKTNNLSYNNYIIYGLDADLIFLSLATLKNNVFLLRESNIINKQDKEVLSLVSIDEIKKYLVLEFKTYIKNEIILDNLIIDFIFICFLIGNDFLPKIPSIDIYAKNNLINGLDLLIYCYSKSFNIFNKYIIDISDIIKFNKDILIDFIDNLILFESDYFVKRYNNTKKIYYEKIDSYEKDLKRLENLNFKINDDVKLGYGEEESWKFRYYKYYYKTINNQLEIVNEACIEYFKGLIWNSYYYFISCPSWKWNYKFSAAPFLSDLRKYIKNFDFNFEFQLDIPLKPLEQLICVLPPQYAFLLPKELSYYLSDDNSEIIYLYPKKFELDMINQTKDWACKPIIPKIDLYILKLIEFKNINKFHMNRNRIETKLF